jgi:organic hydroperoxide reductase OsmC/OhrA
MKARPVARPQREHVYVARLLWTGAVAGPTRDYAAYSREHRIEFEGKPAIVGSADPAFRGDPGLHTPEDLLVASLAACHMLTYLALCALEHIEVTSYSDAAVGTMAETGGAGRFTRVLLRPRVTLARGDVGRAVALHERAHADCFIASSVNFPVDCEPVVEAAVGR